MTFLFNQETKDFKDIIQINLRENDSDEWIEIKKENFKVINDSEVIIGGLKEETAYEVRVVATSLDDSMVIFNGADLYTRGKVSSFWLYSNLYQTPTAGWFFKL